MSLLKDQTDLLSEFNAHNVEYLVVGGHAVNAYTQPRATKNLDVFVRSSAENAKRVYFALAAFGAPLHGVTHEDFFAKPGQYFQIGAAPNRIDVLSTLSGVNFEDAWSKAIHSFLDGLPVRFISKQDLIANKVASGRPRDLGDVDELRKFGREI